MNNALDSAAALSDIELLARVKSLAARERAATAQLIAHLAEVDARRLYLGEGCSSLFTYCTQVLHLSEHAAYGRIEAARAARRFPVILEALADGSLNVTTARLLAPHLTNENVETVLTAARHQTKSKVEELVASLRPQPPVAASVRKLSVPHAATAPSPAAPSPDAEAHECPAKPAAAPLMLADAQIDVEPRARAPLTPARRAEIKPLAPELYKVQFTVSREMHEMLVEAQQLLRHQIPNGDVGELFQHALMLLVTELRRKKHAAVTRPRCSQVRDAHSRHIPAAVKREVWARDGGQCAFIGAAGRCAERGFLEYHHVVPFADGGETTASNIELRCRGHNAYEAERWFGVSQDDVCREVAPAWTVESVGNVNVVSYSHSDTSCNSQAALTVRHSAFSS